MPVTVFVVMYTDFTLTFTWQHHSVLKRKTVVSSGNYLSYLGYLSYLNNLGYLSNFSTFP